MSDEHRVRVGFRQAVLRLPTFVTRGKRAMILQLRRKRAAERISAVLFCLQLLGGSTRSVSVHLEPVLPICVGTAHASVVSMLPPCTEPAPISDRVRRPVRVPAFKMVHCGKCVAGAGGNGP